MVSMGRYQLSKLEVRAHVIIVTSLPTMSKALWLNTWNPENPSRLTYPANFPSTGEGFQVIEPWPVFMPIPELILLRATIPNASSNGQCPIKLASPSVVDVVDVVDVEDVEVELVVVVVVTTVGTPLSMASTISAWLRALLNIAASSISPVRLLFMPSTNLIIPSVQPKPTGLLFCPISLPL